MKKIFTLVVCALMAFSANAQLLITKDGKEIKEGETIEFFAEEKELFPGFSMLECAPSEPAIKNTTGSPVNVSIRVEKLSDADQLMICSFGACDIIVGMSATKTGTIKAGATEKAEIHAGQFNQGEYKSYNAKVTITSGNFKRTFFEKFTYADPAGIESTHAANEVSVNNNVLSYNFGSNADRQLNVYGVSGRLVKSSELAQHGNISLAGLHRGVYIYEIVANGKRVAAHKFVVK